MTGAFGSAFGGGSTIKPVLQRAPAVTPYDSLRCRFDRRARPG
jgi:hypothetical protein